MGGVLFLISGAISNLGIGLTDEFYRSEDNNAKLELVKRIVYDMDKLCDARQLMNLTNVLEDTLKHYSVAVSEHSDIPIDADKVNNMLIGRFRQAKKSKGLSKNSINAYEQTLDQLLSFFPGRALSQITTDNIRDWFHYLINEKGTSEVTVDNYRRNLNSFFTFTTLEGLTLKNPLKKIKTIKRAYQVKQPFSELELVTLRDNITDVRTRAIFELLVSSGLRIGELETLNRTSIDLDERTGYVMGKGSKERKFYFSVPAMYYIKKYLATRNDDNIALFLSHKGNKRIKSNGISRSLRELGVACNINDVHPHRFRRTFATKLLRRGVPLEQIRVFLGHSQIATTKLYVVEDEDEIKYNHKRYVN